MKCRSRAACLLSAAWIGASALVCTPVAASSRYWDGGTADIAGNGNSSSAGGAGTWDTTILNWDGGALAHGAWNNASNDTAIFAGTAATVTLGAGITIGGLQFDTTGYTLSGGTLTLATNANITCSGSVSAAIGSILAGASGFTKSGSGRLALTGTNTYSGHTYVTDGQLDLAAISLSGFGGGSGRNIHVAAGTSIRRNALDNAFLQRLVETTDEVTVMTGTTSNNLDFSGSSGANLPNAFLGNWASNGAKAEYSGNLTPANDTYRFGSSSSSGLLGIIGMLTDGVHPRSLLVGGSRVELVAANPFSGDTVIRAGKLTLGNNLALQNSALDVGSTGGTLALSAGTNSGKIAGDGASPSPTFGGLKGSRNLLSVFSTSAGNNETLLAASAVTGFTLNPGEGRSCAYSGVIGEFATGTTVTKTGAGTQILTGTNTYTGPTTINGGTMQIGDGGTTGSLATPAITNHATLVFNRSNTWSVSQAIGGGGQLIKQGSGTLTLTAAGTYSGNTTVAAGTLKLNHPNPGNDASTVTIAASGAALELNFSGTETVQALVIGGTPMANGIYKDTNNSAPGIGIAQITGTGTLTVGGDVTPPTVIGFADNRSGRPVAANTAVAYTVTFNEDMDSGTVSAADFTNAGTAPISIGTITETVPGVFTVPVTPTDAGTLQLEVPTGATLADVAGNAVVVTAAIADDATLVVFLPDPVSPVLRGISELANSSGAALNIAIPSAVKPGDLLIANIAQYGANSANPTASGWTLIDGRKLGNNTSYYGALLYKVAGVGETGPYVFALGGTSPVAAGVIMGFSGVDTRGGPFDATPGTIHSASSATTAVGPAPQTTTVSPNAAVLMVGMAVGGASANWSGWSAISPGSLAELVDVRGSGTGNNAVSLGAAWAVKPASGATGTGSATLSASTRNGSILLALKPAYSDALIAALAALKAHVTGDVPLTDVQIAAHKAAIVAQQARIGSSVSTIAAAIDLVRTYDELLGPLWVARTLPDRAAVTDDLHYTLYTVMQCLMDWTYNSTNLANQGQLLDGFAFGSSANFPGSCAPPADPEQTHTAVINCNYPDTWGRPVMHEERPARKPTGTYLAPGSIATVTVPASMVGKGYQVRVGCHSWDFSAKPFIKRLDRVSLVYDIVATDTRVANPLGGGIYIEVPAYRSDVGIVNVRIKNAVRSPYFSAKGFHQTTLAEWQNTERNRQAPWADFQSEKFMVQVPTSWVYALNDPVKLMADWDLAADICNDLMGFPHDRGKETLYEQVDVLIRSGAYAPGYPTVNNTYTPGGNSGGYSSSYLVRGPQSAPDFQFHELGHGYLFPKFPGEVESVVNLLHVPVWQRGFGYSLDEAFRKSRSGYPAYATLDTTAIAWMMCDNFLNGIAMTQVEKQYQLKGHAKFVDIARMFGWEKLCDHYRSFNVDYEKSLTIATDVDSLLLRLSGNVGVDIRPLFHFWGVPPINNTSLGNAIEVAHLPASTAIFDTLVHYKSLIPTNRTNFRAFATNWWGRQPLLTGYTEEMNHAERWDAYDEAFAASTANRTQQIIDLYFPNGRPDTETPIPDPMAFATPPGALGQTAITMTAATATDASGVEYYFGCLTPGGHDSDWQDNPSYTDIGLSPGSRYVYQVRARDKSSARNTTVYSATAAATTWNVVTPAADYATWQSANGTSQAFGQDHDNDGVANGVEYFLGGPTGSTTGFTALPGLTDEGGGVFSVTWTHAANYTGTYGTGFVVETSDSLTGYWTVEAANPPDVGARVTFPTPVAVKYTFPAGSGKFARLKVGGP